MLIRTDGHRQGLAEYFVHGRKVGRELSRDEFDERVILEGDLDTIENIINGMGNEGEKYVVITMSFKENIVDAETLKSVSNDFKQFAMSAHDSDEYYYYAEAHLPKIDSYINSKTGEVVKCYPHIHAVIPKINLLSGKRLEVLYKPVWDKNLNKYIVPERALKAIDAFQESTNLKYGLISPKDNLRTDFTNRSDVISRYKSDTFNNGINKNIKAAIFDQIMARKIEKYEDYQAMLGEFGKRHTVNEGKENEYENIKKPGEKGINLNGHKSGNYIFSREFIEKTDAEKQRFLAESPKAVQVDASERAARLKEWHEVGALELKHINSGSRKRYAAYVSADRDGKRAILAERAEYFHTKYKADRAPGTLKTFNQKEPRNERPNYEQGSADQERAGHRGAALHQSNLEKYRREAPPGTITSVRNLSGVGMVQHQRAAQVLLQPNALDRVGGTRAADSEMRRARAGDSRAPGGQERVTGNRSTASARRRDDSVIGQLIADERERKAQANAVTLPEFTQIKRDLDARRLLAHLSKTHGVIPENYEITKGKDGGDRIKVDTKNLNVSDFLTQKMRLTFDEAKPILRAVYAAQVGREVIEARPAPRRELWDAYRKAQPDQAKQRASEWDAQRLNERERRAEIRTDYQAERRAIQNDKSNSPLERKAALSIASMGRVSADMNLREAVSIERQQLKEKHSQPPQARYRAFLNERAEQGDENALAELRRQRDTSQAPTGPNTIEGTSRKRDDEKDKAAHLARTLAYSVDRAGNVTYYADQTKRRALVIDSGQRVTVTADKDSQAVEAGLRLAVQKFGPGLKIEGNEEFKRQVIDAALKTGLRVEFDSKTMNDELTRRRTERDELQARGKAFIASERDKATKPPATTAPEKTPEQERTQQPEAPEAPPKQRDIER